MGKLTFAHAAVLLTMVTAHHNADRFLDDFAPLASQDPVTWTLGQCKRRDRRHVRCSFTIAFYGAHPEHRNHITIIHQRDGLIAFRFTHELPNYWDSSTVIVDD